MNSISVIICCHNSESRISAALESVFGQAELQGEIQIIVVDNNCSDNTLQVAERVANRHARPLTIVKEPTPGLMYARRAGAFAATGDFSCFVDDDNRLDAHYLARAAKHFCLHPTLGYAGGQSRLPPDYLLPAWLTPSLLLSYAVGRQYVVSGHLDSHSPLLWGAGLCVRTVALQDSLRDISTFKCLGRIGSKQLAGDDSELCYKLALQGWRGYYDDDLIVIHAIDPKRFTMERLVSMYSGFGSAKPLLDSLESNLSRQRRRSASLSRSLLYHPLGRIIAYSVLATVWSLRAFNNKLSERIKADYYLAAVRSAIHGLRFRN